MRRLIEVLSSSILLILAASLLLITALAIWLTDRGDVFYRQTRVGLLGRPFELLKFRSMYVNNLPMDDVTEIRAGHDLVTPVGRWIRRFKVDELPQLLNVLRGDMSLVGPRPPLPEHVEKYDSFQRRRLQIRPGMTGWAQVNGGIELTWPERIMMDVWYVDHRSFWLDMRILWQTRSVILLGERRNQWAFDLAAAYANQLKGLTGVDIPSRAAATRLPGASSQPASEHDKLATHFNAATNDARKTSGPCRVVHVTSAHPAFDCRIFHKECKSLAMAGYDVTVIGLGSEACTSRNGVKILAVPAPRSRLERMARTIWKVYRTAVRENAAIYHFHDPELMPVGTLLKMHGKRVIYDVHEDFANEVLYKQYIPALLRGPLSMAVRACEVAFTRSFDRVIAAVPNIARGFPAAKTRVVRNFPWTHEFRGSNSLPYEEREPIAVYVGGLQDERGMREMRQAVELAAKEMPIRLIIAGWVNPGVNAEFLRDAESRLVEYTGLLDRPQVAELLGRARVGLFLMHPVPCKLNGLPVKLFEYMAAGLPVVASDFPLWRMMIGAAKCGLLVDPLNPSLVAEALLWLLRHPTEAGEMGRNGQRAVAENYNWERESESLIATYAELQPA